MAMTVHAMAPSEIPPSSGSSGRDGSLVVVIVTEGGSEVTSGHDRTISAGNPAISYPSTLFYIIIQDMNTLQLQPPVQVDNGTYVAAAVFAYTEG